MRKFVLLAVLFAIAGSMAPAADLSPKTITVSGTADMLAKPDHATVNIGVDTFDKVTVKALDANSALMNRVVQAIRALGIPESAIQTENFAISAVHPEGKNSYEVDYSKTLGYTVSNTLVVSLPDVHKVGEVIDTAVRAGANTSNSVTFAAKNQKELEDKVLADAVRNARHNAEVMAAAEGAKVGKVVSMANSAGYMPRFPMVSNRMGYAAASMAPAIMPGEVTIQAEVIAIFTLE